MTGIHPQDLTELIIRPVLKELNLWSEAAEKLLLGTAAVESNLGYRLKQISGPALGLYQIEPATHTDIWENYLNYRQTLTDKICSCCQIINTKPLNHTQLIYDLRYATVMARLVYWRAPSPLPDASDIAGLAHYWKTHYNTANGKGSIEDFMSKYNQT